MNKLRTMLLAVLIMVTPSVAAQNLALDATGGARYIRGTFANFGWAFTTSEDRSVSALGLWSFTNPGLSESHQVGIWDAAGNLVVSTVVSDADAGVGSASAAGVWRFHPIAATYLAAGSYIIGAYYATDADQFRASTEQNEVNLTLADWLSFEGGTFSNFADGDFFQRPGRFIGDVFNPAFFGPNFLSSDIPEPSTLALLALALAAGGLRCRRR